MFDVNAARKKAIYSYRQYNEDYTHYEILEALDGVVFFDQVFVPVIKGLYSEIDALRLEVKKINNKL